MSETSSEEDDNDFHIYDNNTFNEIVNSIDPIISETVFLSLRQNPPNYKVGRASN
jgi:hypothetical protein